MKINILYVIFFWTLWSCVKEGGPDFKNKENNLCSKYDVIGIQGTNPSSPVFPNTSLISILPYSYNQNSFYSVVGDSIVPNVDKDFRTCCMIVNQLDVQSTTPMLSWTSTNNKLVAAAIFKKRVQLSYSGERINNTSDIVWSWNSGLNSGHYSNGKIYVEYNDGRKVINGKVTEELPDALQNSKAYTWIVWAWNDEGTKIERSSREHFFITPGEVDTDFTLQDLDATNLFGKWNLKNMDNSFLVFPIKSIDFSDKLATITYQGDSVKVVNYLVTGREVLLSNKDSFWITYFDCRRGECKAFINGVDSNSYLSSVKFERNSSVK